MLSLETVLPQITKFKKMKIFGSGRSINKYCFEDIYDDDSFYVIINHFDMLNSFCGIVRSPILYFAHDYHSRRFNTIVAKKGFKSFVRRKNLHVFLHDKEIDSRNSINGVKYPGERLAWIQNLYFYEKAQSNLKYFESTDSSLLGFSSTLHSPLSLPIGNAFIEEIHLYGLDLYIYQNLERFDNVSVGDHAALIFNANKFLLNYLNKKRSDLKFVFFN